MKSRIRQCRGLACCASQKRHQLQATALTRTLGWAKIADGRRIHHLRHIAACLWLARGVDHGIPL
jgi:integrase